MFILTYIEIKFKKVTPCIIKQLQVLSKLSMVNFKGYLSPNLFFRDAVRMIIQMYLNETKTCAEWGVQFALQIDKTFVYSISLRL